MAATPATNTRLVLVGLSGVGKSSAGNIILGREAFKTGISFSSLTLKTEQNTDIRDNRQVTVVDTPGLFNTELSTEQLRAELENAVPPDYAGAVVFLLVIQLGRLSQQEKAMVKTLKSLFGRVKYHTMVLFTYGERLKDTTIQQFISSDSNLKRLISECGGYYHVFSNTDIDNSSQVSGLFDTVDLLLSPKSPCQQILNALFARVRLLTTARRLNLYRYIIPISILGAIVIVSYLCRERNK